MQNNIKTTDLKKTMRYASGLWTKFFPYIALTLFVLTIVRLGFIGFHALYRSDIAQDELVQQVAQAQKKNKFKAEQFKSIVTTIAQREQNSKQRSETVQDIFYQSTIPREKR